MVIPNISTLAILALSAAFAVQTYRISGVQNELLQTKLAHSRALVQQNQEHILVLEQARKVTSELQNTFDHERTSLKTQIAASAAAASDLRKRLQNATAAATAAKARISTLARDGQAGFGNNGTVLPVPLTGSDVLATYSEVDIDEAERADKIRLSLLSCYREYDEVRAKVSSPIAESN